MADYARRKPNESNQERLVSEALAASQAPAELVRQIPPSLPHLVRFPPRFTGMPRGALRIDDVVNLDRYQPDRRNDYSGSQGMYSASSRPGGYGY